MICSYHFAGFRLLTDNRIEQWANCRQLSRFTSPMPYWHTFTLKCIATPDLPELIEKCSNFPLITDIDAMCSVRKAPDGWCVMKRHRMPAMGVVLRASHDCGEMTLYLGSYYHVEPEEQNSIWFPLSPLLRFCIETGIVFRGGLPLHASLVEKNGEGILFLGRSGMGKSTQAKLWEKHLGADFIIGDRPCLKKINGRYYAFGMPWDGKDHRFNQRGVPVKALIELEQAPENRIRRINSMEAKIRLFQQLIVPAWNEQALDILMLNLSDLSETLPFYHLACLPDQAAAELTYRTLFENL